MLTFTRFQCWNLACTMPTNVYSVSVLEFSMNSNNFYSISELELELESITNHATFYSVSVLELVWTMPTNFDLISVLGFIINNVDYLFTQFQHSNTLQTPLLFQFHVGNGPPLLARPVHFHTCIDTVQCHTTVNSLLSSTWTLCWYMHWQNTQTQRCISHTHTQVYITHTQRRISHTHTHTHTHTHRGVYHTHTHITET